MLVVTEALGQARWFWFVAGGRRSAPRPLQDLHAFEHGPHSILGAFFLWGAILRAGWSRGVATPAGMFGLLGAFITVASFAAGPALQQALNNEECLEPRRGGSEATIAVASTVPGSSNVVLLGNTQFDLDGDMKAAMLNGLANPLGNDSAIVPVCPTGNCTFPVYDDGWTHSSIGLCSACIDTTDFVTVVASRTNNTAPGSVNYTLPDSGARAHVVPSAFSSWMSVVSGGNFEFARDRWTPLFATTSREALLNVSILAFSDAPCSKTANGSLACPRNVTKALTGNVTSLVAASCRLYPCMRHYRATVERGVLTERLNTSVPARLNAPVEMSHDAAVFNHSYTAVRDPCRLRDGSAYRVGNLASVPRSPGRPFYNVSLAVPGQGQEAKEFALVEAPAECVYSMSGQYAAVMGNHAATLFSGECTSIGRRGLEATLLSCGPAWWLQPLYRGRRATFATMSGALDLFANAVTNKFRLTGLGPYQTLESAREGDDDMGGGMGTLRRVGDDFGTVVRGTVLELTVCVVPSWRWLILPGTLASLAALLLLGILCRSWTQPALPVWKATALPLMLYGLRDDRRGSSDPGRGELERPQELMELKDVEKVAKQMKVGFSPDPDPGFVLSPGASTIRQRKAKAQQSDTDVNSLMRRG